MVLNAESNYMYTTFFPLAPLFSCIVLHSIFKFEISSRNYCMHTGMLILVRFERFLKSLSVCTCRGALPGHAARSISDQMEGFKLA